MVMCRQHQRTGVGAWWQRRRQPSGDGRYPGADGDLISRGLATALRETATLQVDAPHARNVWLLWLCLCLYSLTYGPLVLTNSNFSRSYLSCLFDLVSSQRAICQWCWLFMQLCSLFVWVTVLVFVF